MSRSNAGQRRVLGQIERDLASEPELARLFSMFTTLTSGDGVPRIERRNTPALVPVGRTERRRRRNVRQEIRRNARRTWHGTFAVGGDQAR